jgi:hypothetical protein
MQMSLFSEEPKRIRQHIHHKPKSLNCELIKESRKYKSFKLGSYYEVPNIGSARLVGLGLFNVSHIVSLGQRWLFTLRTDDGELITLSKSQILKGGEQ